MNGQNVVKVGHRQVVNMIRQGGNALMVKVVMVTRNPDMEDGQRKKSKRQHRVWNYDDDDEDEDDDAFLSPQSPSRVKD